MAASGQFSCPPLGSSYWPLTWSGSTCSRCRAGSLGARLMPSSREGDALVYEPRCSIQAERQAQLKRVALRAPVQDALLWQAEGGLHAALWRRP